MNDRPYFSNSIQELEELFEDNDHDPKILREVLRELSHRKTVRAGRLRGLVESRLAELDGPSLRNDATAHVPSSTEDPKPLPAENLFFGKLDIPAENKDAESAQLHVAEVTKFLDDEFWEQPIPGTEFISTAPIDTREVKNEPVDILDAWLAFEVLSPQSYNRPDDLADGDRRRIAQLANGLPWDGQGEKARPSTRLFYQVIMGAVRLDLATADLLRAFGDQRPERPKTRGMAALGVVTVDQKGRPAGDNPVAVSSFGYGYQQACQGQFGALKEWPKIERDVTARLKDFLIRHDRDTGEVLPITHAQIKHAASWLTTGFGIPAEHFIAPQFAVRVYQWFMAPKPPEPLLLNSFFLDDIALSRQLLNKGDGGKALRRYMAIEKPDGQTDLIEDREALERALAPKRVPIARWPAAGSHSLVLLQQAAVNLAFEELADSGILGVNGPPGTGKTTLLRDLVAGVVAERAEALMRFEDPEKAFQHADKIRFGSGFSHLYRMDDSIIGHEILVASANNKAVENISREIPELEHIEATRAPDYFASIANNVAGDDAETWGAAAAVLGNAANRVSFYNHFWKDENHGMQQYLWACQGRDTDIVTTDDETGEELRQVRPVIAAENPPGGREEALEEWLAERKRYRATVKKTKSSLAQLEKLRTRLRDIAELSKEAARLQAVQDADRFAFSKQLSVFQNEVHHLTAYKRSHDMAVEAVAEHKVTRPSLLSRIFWTKLAREWRKSHAELTKELRVRRRELARRKNECMKHKRLSDQLKRKATASNSILDESVSALNAKLAALSDIRQSLGSRFADDAFWQAPHDEFHKSVAWLDETTQSLRDECFAAAFDLHKAFIGAAAKPIRNNIKALFSVILGSGIDPEKRSLLQSLWSSLFLVVPVVSTTFASVNRMLGPLPQESLGWLLIDEAGQAAPQMALGAILRSRRALVVGDPLQIEPVVTLSNSLVSRIAAKYGVDNKEWMAPWSSVQGLADRTSDYAAWIERQDGTIRVGAPLLVHRRCEEPMFGISNAISYGGLMVQATAPGSSAVRDVLGRSQWIDVAGPSSSKWCANEGEAVISMLQNVVAEGIEFPDIFIISPFRIVAQSMRRRVQQEGGLLERLSPSGRSWLYDHIGTVHTFQGKQAEIVIFLLGAQGAKHTFARQWASRPPNLVNVAASRAKKALYVVGNRNLWKEVGCFPEVAARL